MRVDRDRGRQERGGVEAVQSNENESVAGGRNRGDCG